MESTERMPADYRFAFLVEWLDPQAQLVRQYLLFFYSIDGTVEMDDIKNRRKFLRRCEYPGISFADLYLGATVNVYSRELVVVDYGDEFTKGQLEQKKEKTLALIKPDAFLKAGKIVNAIYKDGFRIGRMRSLELSRADAQEFYQEHQGKPFFDGLTQFMSSGPIVALELVADGAIQKWRKLIGPTNTFKAREEAPGCLRAQFGTDGTRNACHGSDSTAQQSASSTSSSTSLGASRRRRASTTARSVSSNRTLSRRAWQALLSTRLWKRASKCRQ